MLVYAPMVYVGLVPGISYTYTVALRAPLVFRNVNVCDTAGLAVMLVIPPAGLYTVVERPTAHTVQTKVPISTPNMVAVLKFICFFILVIMSNCYCFFVLIKH
jgi:hypothetical protein